MEKRGIVVNDPRSVVLVVNNSGGTICLPREHNKDIIFHPGELAQIEWAEFVRFKNIPHFGRFLKLSDSVVISDGKVKIRNVVGSISNDELVDLLPQGVSVIKEFTLTLNAAERHILHSFLEQRAKLGIETEKCEEVIEFIEKEFPEEELVSKEKEETVEPQEAAPKKTRKKKTKISIKGDKKLVENEEHLSVNVIDIDGDSD